MFLYLNTHGQMVTDDVYNIQCTYTDRCSTAVGSRKVGRDETDEHAGLDPIILVQGDKLVNHLPRIVDTSDICHMFLI